MGLFAQLRRAALFTSLLFCLTAPSAFAQESWEARDSGTTNTLWGVAYGNGTWIAVGVNGTILSSPDGRAWTKRDSGFPSAWLTSVCFDQGLWVAVGGSPTDPTLPLILTSGDGATWVPRVNTSRSSPTEARNARINVVRFGNSQFLALDDKGCAWSSFDGVAWTYTTRSAGTGQPPGFMRGLAYGPSLFVAGGLNYLDTIVDYGRTLLSYPTGLQIEAVAWGRNLFVVAGTGPDAGFSSTSPDGRIWTNHPQVTGLSARGAVFFNNQFVLAGNATALTGGIATSTDGVTWTSRATLLPAGSTFFGLGAGADTLIAVGDNGFIARSVAPARSPVIVSQPVSATAGAGGTAAFSVSAGGTPPLTYQWRFNNQDLAGATGDTLLLASAAVAQSGPYTCVVKNALGSTATTAATLTVTSPQPSDSPLDLTFQLGPTLNSGPVTAVEQPDGKILLGGFFTLSAPGRTQRSLARLNADGSFDPTFIPAVISATVQAIALQPDGKILIGGHFASVDGSPCNGLARLNADGTLDSSFALIPPAPTVTPVKQIVIDPAGRILAMYDTTIKRYSVAGAVDTFWGTASYGYAYGSGTSISGIGTSMVKMAVRPDGKVVAMTHTEEPGIFIVNVPPASYDIMVVFNATTATRDSTSIANTGREGFRYGPTLDLRVLASGEVQVQTASGTTNRAGAIAADGSRFYAGSFNLFRNIVRHHLARLTPDGLLDGLNLGEGFFGNNRVASPPNFLLPLRSGQILALGDFTQVDAKACRQVARLNATSPNRSFSTPSILPVDSLYRIAPVGQPVYVSISAVGSPAPQFTVTSFDGTAEVQADGRIRLTMTKEGLGAFTVTATNAAGESPASVFYLRSIGTAPLVLQNPVAVQTNSGRTFQLSVTAAGSTDLKYQWYKEDTLLPGATAATLTSNLLTRIPVTPPVDDPGITVANSGSYRVVVSNSLGSITSAVARVGVDETSRLLNLSTRAYVGAPATPLIVGFVIQGAESKQLLLRAVGPSLAGFGVDGFLPDPSLQIFGASGLPILSNDDWTSSATFFQAFQTQFTVGAFPMGTSSLDAALLATLPPGAYTVVISAKEGAPGGIALGEIYEADRNSSRLTNLSARGLVSTGGAVMIPALVTSPTGAPKKFLIRGLGPALTAFGVSEVLANPSVSIVNAAGQIVAANDNWEQNPNLSDLKSATAQLTFPLSPGSKDAALLVTLPPGSYTCLVRGEGDSQGTALVEIYELP